MPFPAKLGDAMSLPDPLGEDTGGDRPRGGAKAPAALPQARLRRVVPQARLWRDGGGRALPVLRTGTGERCIPSCMGGTRSPRSFHIL
jgi:hypothetical protein